MPYYFPSLLLALTFLIGTSAHSQETERGLTKRVMIKTNVLSLFARKPTISVEKAFSRTFAAEVSFVQGVFNDFMFTDQYNYNGFLLRAKKYIIDLEFGSISPYANVYVGTLRRNIQTKGQTGNNGWFSYPSKDFSANSVRGGGGLGLCYLTKSKFVIDGQINLGYGKYTKIYKPDPNSQSNGYLDAQVWLSFGYCF